jgi:hypothetical protein
MDRAKYAQNVDLTKVLNLVKSAKNAERLSPVSAIYNE